ncbi:outer membrane protein assembly factor BamE [Comamonas sp. JUb58]|uniref:outer membrane protein assembly factor BamE n=1 Tax=Comamonas sp. JUb58 TaxID=2485114 RepID=UPI00105BCE19|nr:outer membrane protein assembly factor BamE [Comamonas sp. JUb58]TDS84002.1 hypothetical protein EDF71_103122 [Comamonas sp. JUb58]
MSFLTKFAIAASALAVSVFLAGCDQQRIKELEEHVSTEQDVRDRFGEPNQIWDEADGSHTLEYTRQPAGAQNYMITIGTDGKMSALRQVLAPAYFAKVQPGMDQQEIRRLLGQPAKRTSYPLKNEAEWDWGWVDPPSTKMLFTVVFDAQGKVLRSNSTQVLPSR